MKKILIVIITLSTLNSFSQKKDSYLPIVLNNELNYVWMGRETKVSFDFSIEIDGKTYYSFNKKNELYNISELIAISNDTVYNYSDFYKKHIPKFCFNAKIGERVGLGKIVSKTKSFKTKKGKIYKNLLVVSFDNGNHFEYYKRGIGLIAIKREKRFIFYLNE